jgi:hypothetical protein
VPLDGPANRIECLQVNLILQTVERAGVSGFLGGLIISALCTRGRCGGSGGERKLAPGYA